MTRRTGIALLLLASLASVGAGPPHRKTQPPGKTVADLAADVVRAMKEYRAALERALPLHEAAHARAVEVLAERRKLHEEGGLAASYVEEAERAVAEAEAELVEAQRQLDETDRMLIEASVHAELARLPPLRRGGFQDTATLVRFAGTARWSPRDVPGIDRAFAAVFGRRLPISAFGQTRLHDRLGLDHRGAVDVAVHPDSAAGRWLMDHLRRAGIPFIGVRGAVAGAATGAHVHIGPASPRFSARP